MKVLMLSIDATISDRNSQSYKRIKQQAGLVDGLVVFVLKKGKEYRIYDGNLSVWSSPLPGRVFSTIWAYNKARDIVKEKGIEVITAQDPFFVGTLARKLAKKFNIGYEIQVHGDFFSNPYWRKESLLNKLVFNMGLKNVKKANSVRVVSGRVKNDLIERGINENKIIKVPIFVDWRKIKNSEASFVLKEKYPQFKFIALSLGRLEDVKHIDLLVRVWKDVVVKNPEAGLIIVGEGRQKNELEQWVKQQGLEKNIIIEPLTKDPVSYFKGADCFVLTSWYEGWGRTIIESLAANCPVIMTDVGCAGEVVKHDENGLVIPVNDKSALGRALDLIAHDNDLRQRLISNTEKYLIELPDLDETMRLYVISWEKAKK